MPEIFPNTLGGGLEIWASIFHVAFLNVICDLIIIYIILVGLIIKQRVGIA